MPKPKVKSKPPLFIELGATVKPSKPKVESRDLKSLPDIADKRIDDKDEIIILMEELAHLQEMVGQKPDEKKKKEGSGLLKRINDIKVELSAYMLVEGEPGFRHNNLAFYDGWIDGRVTLNEVELRVQLIQEAGLEPEMVDRCIKAAYKQGDGYYRRQLVDLNKPRGSSNED